MTSQQRYAEYMHTDYWKTVAAAVKVKAKYKCQVCNSPHDLNAHHRSYENRGNELDHLDDLVCLCRRCHLTFHGKTSETPEPKPAPRNDPLSADLSRTVVAGEPMVLLTRSMVEACRSDRGAFTGCTLAALGVKPFKNPGWAERLDGSLIAKRLYEQAYASRNTYKTGSLK